MAWSTPKTDWDTDDAVGTTDLNRIENNILSHCGDADISGIATVASADSCDITKKINVITGNNAIKYLKTAGFIAGMTIYMQFTTGVANLIHHLQGSVPGGYAAIKTVTGADISMENNDVAIVNYDGTYWNFLQLKGLS